MMQPLTRSSSVAVACESRVLRTCLVLSIAMLGLCCNHSERRQYVVVHVLYDPSSSFAPQLNRADLDFGATRRYVASGKLIIVATLESGSYSQFLQRFSNSPWDAVIANSESDIPSDTRQQLGSKTQVCGHHPAFILNAVTGEQREATQGYLQFLALHCK